MGILSEFKIISNFKSLIEKNVEVGKSKISNPELNYSKLSGPPSDAFISTNSHTLTSGLGSYITSKVFDELIQFRPLLVPFFQI